MRDQGWKAIAEFIGIGAIVASLVFVGVELQQSRQIALAARQHEQMERELAVHDLIVENIPLLLKMGSGERLSEEEEILANRLVRTLQVVRRTPFLAMMCFGEFGNGLFRRSARCGTMQ